MHTKLVKVFTVLRHYSDGNRECVAVVAECNSNACAVEAVKYYGGADSVGVYYCIELRYKVVWIGEDIEDEE